MEKFTGARGRHKWSTKSACAHMLYEHMDLDGNKVQPYKKYAEYHAKRKFKNFSDPNFKERTIEIIFELYDYMSEDLDIFPAFGTLLGFVRDQDLIPHDDDVDFGYFKKDSNTIIAKMDALHGKNGYSVIRNEYNTLFSLHKQDVLIDFYEYEMFGEGEDLHQGHRPFYNLKYDEVFPLTTIQFRQKEFKSINSPTKFFERYYGHNWKIPR